MSMNNDRVVQLLKALGEPNRFRMVQELARAGELSCNELGARFDLSQPTVSHHLKILIDAGVLQVRAVGQRHLVSVNHPTLQQVARLLPGRLAGTSDAGPSRLGQGRSTS